MQIGNNKSYPSQLEIIQIWLVNRGMHPCSWPSIQWHSTSYFATCGTRVTSRRTLMYFRACFQDACVWLQARYGNFYLIEAVFGVTLTFSLKAVIKKSMFEYSVINPAEVAYSVASIVCLPLKHAYKNSIFTACCWSCLLIPTGELNQTRLQCTTTKATWTSAAKIFQKSLSNKGKRIHCCVDLSVSLPATVPSLAVSFRSYFGALGNF